MGNLWINLPGPGFEPETRGNGVQRSANWAVGTCSKLCVRQYDHSDSFAECSLSVHPDYKFVNEGLLLIPLVTPVVAGDVRSSVFFEYPTHVRLNLDLDDQSMLYLYSPTSLRCP
ncbi:hypothetical protein TNCV_4346221 [Trichonephila clavipes]|nr:hypothetical protein TNCV_4346221 [Trichonephila clavipes]